jgi:uncharacterized protein (DUF924 family)
MDAFDIIQFWFEEIEPKSWWHKDPDFDRLIHQRYQSLHQAAGQCELYDWRTTPQGRLAEIIILDQFSRNMYRDTPRAFGSDPLALALAQEAIAHQADLALTPIQRTFLYLPFMHSESRAIHTIAVELYRNNGIEDNLTFELKHQAIIERFGRYPHRNAILGRQSSPEELEFLRQPGSRF